MSNQQTALVNQRLYFCRLHLNWLQDSLDNAELPAHVVEQSLAESAVFHLVLAYRLYLAEVATAYGTPCDSLDNAEQLAQLLAKEQRESAEAREMQLLEDGGWLGELLLAWDNLMGGDSGPQAQKTGQEISVMQVSSQALDIERCQAYLQSLQTLIENQRSRLEEW